MTLSTRATIIAAVLVVAPAAAATDYDTCFSGNGDAAIAACTRVIDAGRHKGKDLAAIYGQRGFHFHVADQEDRAIANFNEAIRIEPTARRYANRANSKRNKGDIEGAITDLTASIDMDPKYPVSYAVRGLIWADAKHDLDKAIADYDQAIMYNPKFTSAYTYRGMAYQEKGDLDHAKADFRFALSLPPVYSDGKWAHEEASKRLDKLEAPARRP
jgi:tetratricopeptide (TPR) repeat protein